MAGDIVIIGGGFAGLRAARVFAAHRKHLAGRRVLLVDAKRCFDFLPFLPEIAGGRLGPEAASWDLWSASERLRVNYAQAEVTRVDSNTREVFCANGRILGYEYLLICCGVVTNFYGMADVERHAFKCDNGADAAALFKKVGATPEKRILIVGGGESGVQMAANLAVFLRRRKIRKYSLSIVEKAEDILGGLPLWMRDYARVALARLRVNVWCDSSLAEVTERHVRLSNGLTFENYLMIWTAGVRAPNFVGELPCGKDKQGRLKVDASLRCAPHVFAAGSVTGSAYPGTDLPVTFSLALDQASVAAKNIVRLIRGSDKLAVIRARTWWHIVPLAGRRACGRILFFRAAGIPAWLTHYLMCMRRLPAWSNRLAMRHLLFSRRKT